jgi:hypothetical protein
MKFFKIAFGFIVIACISQLQAQNITNATDVHSTQGRQPQGFNNASIEESKAISEEIEEVFGIQYPEGTFARFAFWFTLSSCLILVGWLLGCCCDWILLCLFPRRTLL